MDPSSPSYIERDADAYLLEALLRGEYVFLLDSRQKGKSSMVARTIVKLKERGVLTVKLDLQRIGANVTPEQWYAGMLAEIGQELGLSAELFEHWGSHQAVGPLARWIGALLEVVLTRNEAPIVIFIDEVDFVRALPFSTDEFFAGIRDCFNRRSEVEAFQRLTFCLVGVTTPGQLIRNPGITPFNVGTQIDLSDFTEQETRKYVPVLDCSQRSGAALLSRVHYWLQGHPYLTQVVCGLIAEDPEIKTSRDVDGLIERLYCSPEARQRESNFCDVERRLLEPDLPHMNADERRSQVLELYRQLLQGRRLILSEENPLLGTLKLSGICASQGGSLRLRNRLYSRIFDEKWRRQNLPDAEKRRQQTAARIAILRTASAATVIVFALSSTALGMWRLSGDRQRALTALERRSDDLSRVSDERKRSLAQLQNTAASLERVSLERKQSLDKLRVQAAALSRVSRDRKVALDLLEGRNEELKTVSEARKRALTELQERTEDLQRRDYDGQMATVQLAIAKGQWVRVAELLANAKASPFRGWEWDYTSRLVRGGSPRVFVERGAVLERQPDGSVCVISKEGIFTIEKQGLKRIRPTGFHQPHARDNYKRGSFRRGSYRATRDWAIVGHAIRDAETDREWVAPVAYTTVMDIDPERGRYLLVRDESVETLELRNIQDNRLIAKYKGPEEALAGRFLPDGTCLSLHFAGEERRGNAQLRHWNAEAKTLDVAETNQQYADGIAVSADGTLYCAWGGNDKLDIRSVGTNKLVASLPDHPQRVTDVVFSDDGAFLASGCNDAAVRLFDAKTGVFVQALTGQTRSILSLAFQKDGRKLLSTDIFGFLVSWELDGYRALDDLQDHGVPPNGIPDNPIRGAFVSADGETMLSGSTKGIVVSRNLRSGRVVKRIPKDSNDLAFLLSAESADCAFIGLSDGRAARLNPRTLIEQRSVKVFDHRIHAMNYGGSGRYLYVQSDKFEHAVLDAKTLQVLHRFESTELNKKLGWRRLAFGNESPYVAFSVVPSRSVELYNLSDGRLVKRWTFDKEVRSITQSIDGKGLAVATSDPNSKSGRLALLDTSTLNARTTVSIGASPAEMRFSPDGRSLLGFKVPEENAYLWDARSGALRARLNAGAGIGFGLFSPDGRRFVTSGGDRTMTLWDTETGLELMTLQYPARPNTPKYEFLGLEVARFSTDGNQLVMVCPDQIIRVWKSGPIANQTRAFNR